MKVVLWEEGELILGQFLTGGSIFRILTFFYDFRLEEKIALFYSLPFSCGIKVWGVIAGAEPILKR